MKKIQKQKLVLNKEVVRELDQQRLDGANGAWRLPTVLCVSGVCTMGNDCACTGAKSGCGIATA